ncbi:MAG: BamA/TamA family outer membrane protein [Gemmatimonadota bacterium]
MRLSLPRRFLRRVGLLSVLSTVVGLAAVPPAAGQSGFGRNKVQYRARDFQVIETAHFDVFFYEEERAAAYDAARMAERIYGRLSRLLDHEFQRRKPIILYASQTDFQGTNVLGGHVPESTGGVTESLRDRVLLPLTGSYAEFEHVLAHELVHAFQFDVLKRSAVERSASPFAFVPSLWFMEGMAEYLSLGRIDAKTTAWMRDAALSGYLRTIGEMDRFNDFLSYRFGQSLWNYIGARWGDEAIGELLEGSARVGPERAFERTLGVTLDELSRQWHEAVRAAHLPDVRRSRNVDLVARRITSHTLPVGRGKSPSFIAPALSPDGRRIAYLSDQGHDLYSFYDLYVADVASAEDGRRLVEAARGGDFESLRYLSSSAEFSPDGEALAFVAKRGGLDAIYVVDAATGEVRRSREPELNGLQSPSWSPDGRRIVFTGLLGGISDLYVWHLDDDRIERLTDDRLAQLHPAWSPDGATIAYATDAGPETDMETLAFGPLRIELLDLATRSRRPLPGQDGGQAINPVWSPDGETVAYLSTRSGAFNVFLQRIDGGEVRQLTDVLTGTMGQGALLTSPGLSWAREADRLAFSYFEEAGFNLYVVDDPRERAAPPAPAASARTAAAEIGISRTVERRDGALAGKDGSPASFYLGDEGPRRSDFRDEDGRLRPAPERPELSVRGLLDSVSLALPDTAAFAARDYAVDLAVEVVGRPSVGAQTGGYFGNSVYGGSYILLSDMLGDHNLYIAGDVQGSFDNARVLTSYTYLKRRLNLGVSFVQYPFFRFRGTRLQEVPGEDGRFGEFNLFQRDQYRSVAMTAVYPLSRFTRLEGELRGSSLQTDQLLRGVFRDEFEPFRRTIDGPTRVFVQPSLAWVHDNSLPGFTGAVAGRRLRASVAPALGDLNMADVRLDLRQYLPLPASLTLAQRFLAVGRFDIGPGSDAAEFELAWGGPYYLRGYDPDSYGAAECAASREASEIDLFCPAQERAIGSSTLLLNTELRLPLLNSIKDAWLPLNAPAVDAALFFDVGAAWTPGLHRLVWSRDAGEDPFLYRQPLASVGAGLRMNLFFAVLRLDYTVPLSRGDEFRDGHWSLSFGEMF